MHKFDDLSAWRLFESLASSRSFSVTAEAFGVEPSTVTRALDGLEASLGQQLVSRAERPIRLTPKGEWAAKRIGPVLAAHQKIVDAMTSDNAALKGNIRVSVAPAFATRYLMPLLAEFSKECPQVSFEIEVGMKAADLRSQKCDVAVLTGRQDAPGLVSLPRGRNLYLALAAPAYVAKYGMPLQPEDLERHTVFVYTGPVRSTTRTLRKGTEERPIIFGKTVTSPDVIAIREGVLSGLGVSVDMPLVQCWEEVRDGKLVPILPGWHRPQIECFVVLSSSSWRKRRCRVFAEWFSKALQKLFQGVEDAVSGIVALEPRKGAQG